MESRGYLALCMMTIVVSDSFLPGLGDYNKTGSEKTEVHRRTCSIRYCVQYIQARKARGRLEMPVTDWTERSTKYVCS